MIKTITPEQVTQYQADGFLICEGLLEEALIIEARSAVDRILSNGELSAIAEMEPANPTLARRIWSPLKRDEVFRKLAFHEGVVQSLRFLIGESILLQYTKLNVKPPRIGSVVEWHQDFSYYPHTNSDLVSCLIYLDDADEENACLKVARGSHKLGLLSHDIDGYFRGKLANLQAVGIDEKDIVSCPGKAGAIVFVHCLTAHASAVNASDRYRRAFIPAYRAADAFPIYFGPHAAHNEPNIEIVCGLRSRVARCSNSVWNLPIAQAEFNSLYQVQEGSHIKSGSKTSTGYFAHETLKNEAKPN